MNGKKEINNFQNKKENDNIKENNSFIFSFKKAFFSMIKNTPMFLGIILLLSIINALIPPSSYTKIFSGNILLDPFIGAFLGSLLTGNPITSYILGGEFLKQGISLIAILAFIISWVTVGIVQLPAESIMLGKKFAIIRNILSFIFAILIAIIINFLL